MPGHRPHGQLISRGAPLVALGILAFVVAFHGLAAKSLDLDEAVSVEHARLGASVGPPRHDPPRDRTRRGSGWSFATRLPES